MSKKYEFTGEEKYGVPSLFEQSLDDVKVFGDAKVYENARVFGDDCIHGEAKVIYRDQLFDK